MRLSAEDRRRVADAVAAAEESTRAEIRCVEIPNPSLLTVASVAALVAVFVPVLLVLAGWRPNELGRTGGWTVIDPAPLEALRLYVGLQAVCFVLVLLLALLPWARCAPPAWRRRWTRRAANRQFDALGMAHTLRRSAVLVVVAPAYRQAALISDAGASAFLSATLRQDIEGALSDAMKRDALAAGLVSAIAQLGVHLARGRPAGDDRNELPDQLAKFRPDAE
jgi:uncharacterized membrane protein